MPTTIDAIELQVKSSAEQAKQGLQSLVGTLEKLKTATSGFSSNMESIKVACRNIADGIKYFDGTNASKMTEALKALGKLKSFSGVSIDASFATGIREIANAANSLNFDNTLNLKFLGEDLAIFKAIGKVSIDPNLPFTISNLVSSAKELEGKDYGSFNQLAMALGSLKGIGNIKMSPNLPILLLDIAEAAGEVAKGGDYSALIALSDALKGFSKLKLGSVDVGHLAEELRKLPEAMTALKEANVGSFTEDLQKLTDTLKPLASALRDINVGFKDLPKIANTAGVSVQNVTNNMNDRGRGIGTGFMTRYFHDLRSLSRIGTMLARPVNEANQYVEALNLFTASLGEFANQAQAYGEKVSETLGIDPADWLRNQGVFMTLADGFGVAGDRAYVMSQQLTQLGYDLSSFFNLSVSDAMQKLQSGFSGELEPLALAA